MDLLLWRHAEAEIGEPDLGRALTQKGQKQAQRMAHWLDRNLPSTCRILVSPALRTVQTADALGRKYKLTSELGPDATAEQVLKAVNWPHAREPVLAIGHQPWLGQVASLLLAGSMQDWSVRKANIWWIVQRERDELTENYLKAVIAPELVVK